MILYDISLISAHHAFRVKSHKTLELYMRPLHFLFSTLCVFSGLLVVPVWAAPVPIEQALITKRFVTEKLDVVGDIRAHDRVELAAEVAGTVAGIFFEEGQPVSAGQTVLVLDDALYTAELRRAEASFNLAKLRYERDQQLYEKRTISQAVFEQSQAELQERRAALDVASVRLSKTKVVAPFSGWAGLRHLSVGDYVSPGEPLLTLVNDQPLLIDFNVPFRVSGQIKRGDKVTFIAGSSRQIRQGDVVAIESSMNNASRSLQVRAKYENAERDVLSGNFAKVMFEVPSPSPLLVIPAQALIGVSGGYVVYLNDNGVAVRHSVRIVRREGETAILEDTLPDLPLIIAGFQRLRPGSEVVVTTLGE